jgi:two-component system, OmpR family, alkaline phosphatase synthesis response regulator PhoP
VWYVRLTAFGYGVNEVSRILLIEDDEFVRKALQVCLEKAHFQVLTARTGVQGLQVAEDESPNLIVLDLTMPDIDGLEVLNRLTKNVVTWDIPVVVLTAKTDPHADETSYRLGVKRFLRKPFSPKRVVGEIVRLLGASPA